MGPPVNRPSRASGTRLISAGQSATAGRTSILVGLERSAERVQRAGSARLDCAERHFLAIGDLGVRQAFEERNFERLALHVRQRRHRAANALIVERARERLLRALRAGPGLVLELAFNDLRPPR